MDVSTYSKQNGEYKFTYYSSHYIQGEDKAISTSIKKIRVKEKNGYLGVHLSRDLIIFVNGHEQQSKETEEHILLRDGAHENFPVGGKDLREKKKYLLGILILRKCSRSIDKKS